MPLAGKQLQQGIVIDGQFELDRQLGAGGMGTVWAATDLRLGRSVAVKFLSSAFVFDEPSRQRFEREARLGGRIRSPHVVQVFSQGLTDDGVPYVVMELLDGEDLSYRIARSGPCSLVETAVIVEQLCRALSRAHQSGLVHRDIKPHNIFLLTETGGTFVKLLDFGIAKDIGTQLQSLTLTGSMLGTVCYCSPEQLREPQSVGPLSDLWALGVVIYQMLTGVTPFKGETLPEVVVKITEGAYTRATKVNPTLPAAIDAFFEQVLQIDPTRRLQSAEDVAEALGRIVRANSSAVLQRTQPAHYALPQHTGSAPRAQALRWPLAVLIALLGACGVYYLTSRPGAQPETNTPAPLEHDTRAATSAAPVKADDGSPATATSPAPAQAQSHAQQPEQRAPQPQSKSRPSSKARPQKVTPVLPPPTAAGALVPAPDPDSESSEPKPKATVRRDFGF
jgi:serine/threonine protein kinase